MILIPTELEGVLIVEQRVHTDLRGSFMKNFSHHIFASHDLECDFKESYYTQSAKGVIRGMHFQIPPHDHAKLITVVQGTILDVILDLRRASPTYGRYITIELSQESGRSLYISRGFAHGFCTLSASAITSYMVTSEYAPDHDVGIYYDGFGFRWPVSDPILSERDKKHPAFASFNSPF